MDKEIKTEKERVRLIKKCQKVVKAAKVKREKIRERAKRRCDPDTIDELQEQINDCFKFEEREALDEIKYLEGHPIRFESLITKFDKSGIGFEIKEQELDTIICALKLALEHRPLLRQIVELYSKIGNAMQAFVKEEERTGCMKKASYAASKNIEFIADQKKNKKLKKKSELNQIILQYTIFQIEKIPLEEVLDKTFKFFEGKIAWLSNRRSLGRQIRIELKARGSDTLVSNYTKHSKK